MHSRQREFVVLKYATDIARKGIQPRGCRTHLETEALSANRVDATLIASTRAASIKCTNRCGPDCVVTKSSAGMRSWRARRRDRLFMGLVERDGKLAGSGQRQFMALFQCAAIQLPLDE